MHLLLASSAMQRLTHAPGRSWRAVLALLQLSPLGMQHPCLFSRLCFRYPSFLGCKSSSAGKTVRSQGMLFSLDDNCKGKHSILLPFSDVGSLKYLFYLLGGGWVFLNKVVGDWYIWRIYSPCCHIHLRRLSFSSASTQKIKHRHIFYSLLIIVDRRKCSLVIEGKCYSFCSHAIKNILSFLNTAICSLLYTEQRF